MLPIKVGSLADAGASVDTFNPIPLFGPSSLPTEPLLPFGQFLFVAPE
jgi:hypothetical protein